jgi:hypothetical protein
VPAWLSRIRSTAVDTTGINFVEVKKRLCLKVGSEYLRPLAVEIPRFGTGEQLGKGEVLAVPLLPGLEKTRGLKKKTAQWVFWAFLFFFGILGDFGFFWFFYIFAQKREFLGFFGFKNTFRCIQTLKYNHS